MAVNKKLLEEKAKEYAEVAQVEDDVRLIVERVYVWAGLNRKTAEIAKDLRLSKKQFDDLQKSYPAIMGALKMGKDYANVLLNFSAQEMAMGHYYLEREVVQMETVVEFDENGRKVREIKRPVKVMIREEQKQDATMLKFLLSAKQPDTYGKSVVETAEVQLKREFEHMDNETRREVISSIKRKITKSDGE